MTLLNFFSSHTPNTHFKIQIQIRHNAQFRLHPALSIHSHDESKFTYVERSLPGLGVIHKARVCSKGHPMNLSFGSQQRWRCRIRGCCEEKGLRAIAIGPAGLAAQHQKQWRILIEKHRPAQISV